MPDQAKRIDLRLGDLAVSAEGFDDPVPVLKQVIRLAQRALEETPEISQTGFTLSEEQADGLISGVAERMQLPREQISAQPGLIISAVAASSLDAAPQTAAASLDPDDTADEGTPDALTWNADPEAGDEADTAADPVEAPAEMGEPEDTSLPDPEPEEPMPKPATMTVPETDPVTDVVVPETDPEPAMAEPVAPADILPEQPPVDEITPEADVAALPLDANADAEPAPELFADDDIAALPAQTDEPSEPVFEETDALVPAAFANPTPVPEPGPDRDAPEPIEPNEANPSGDQTIIQSPGALLGGVAAQAGLANIFAGREKTLEGPPEALVPTPEPTPTANDSAPEETPAPAAMNIFAGASSPSVSETPADPDPAAEPIALADPAPSEPRFAEAPASLDPAAEPEPAAFAPPPQLPSPEEPVASPMNIFAGTGSAPSQDPGLAAEAPVSRLQEVVSRYRSETGAPEPATAPPALDPEPEPMLSDPDPAYSPGGGGGSLDPSELASRAEASSVPDLLAAAAAWLTLVDGRSSFGRREVMDVFDQIPGDHPRTLEARIKGYGKLVRNGSLELVDDGRFALSAPELERFRSLTH